MREVGIQHNEPKIVVLETVVLLPENQVLVGGVQNAANICL